MGIFGWILYIFLGILLYLIITFINRKYSITKIEKLVISIVLLMFISGVLFRLGINYTSDIFLIFVFMMIIDIIYNSYFLDRDFFDRNEGNITYYIILIIIGFIINQEFINRVEDVFLTGEDLRLVLWFISIIFIYKFICDKNILCSISKDKNKYMSGEAILVNYTKLRYKYMDVCKYKNKDLENVIYSIMIFNNNKRSKILRNYDYFMFRLNGNTRKLGIMQVESTKFINDIQSIDIVYKKLEKLYEKKSGSKSNKVNDVLKSYSKNDYDYIKYIFDIVSKF